MTNLVLLYLFNIKGVHWNSEKPEYLTRNNNVFCNLDQIGHHWVFERNTGYGSFTVREGNTRRNTVRKSVVRRHATFTGAQMHRVLGHASPEVIEHVSG